MVSAGHSLRSYPIHVIADREAGSPLISTYYSTGREAMAVNSAVKWYHRNVWDSLVVNLVDTIFFSEF